MGTSYNPKIITNNLVLNIDPANIKSYPAGQDSYVNSVSLMLDGESLNDSSTNNVTITNNGASVSSSQFKFGSNSLYISGSSVYISMPTSTNFAFGTGDYTIECWLYMTTISGQQTLFVAGTGSNVGNFAAYFNGGSTLDIYNNGIAPAKFSGSCVISANTWFHFAVTRSSGTVRVFINGSLQSSATDTYSYTSTSGTARIGNDGLGGFNLNAYIDDFRITKGYARYTANFTPPAGPLSLPGRITDLTRNKAIGTFKNGPTYSGGAIVFDGSNDYITLPTSSLFNFGTGDFTVEMWIYPTLVKQFSLLDFRINETNPNGNGFVIGTNSSNQWVVYQGANQIIGSTVVANQWVQLIVNRVGTSVKMFLNGVQAGSTWTTSNSFTDGAFVLGTDYPLNARFFQGNVSSIKIYKGKGFSNSEILQNYNATKGRFGL